MENLALTEFRKESHEISNKTGVPVSKINIWYSEAEGEYCVYLDGKWYGYLEL